MPAKCSHFAVGLLIAFQGLLLASVAAQGSSPEKIWEGDVTILGEDLYNGCNILLRGNLTITGSLTLMGVDLQVESPASGAFKIIVAEGGSFTVLASSKIHSTDPTVHFLFQVRPEASLVMNDSELHDCGWDDIENWTVNPALDRGLYIESSNARITNCTITENCVGIIVDNGTSPSICNNTVARNDADGIEALGGSSPLIDGNTVSGNMANNINFWGGGIYSESSSPLITNNTIDSNIDYQYGVTYGVYLGGGSNPVVEGNTVSGHHDPFGYGSAYGIYCAGADSLIARNTLTDNDNGAALMGCAATFEENTVSNNDNPTEGIGIHDSGDSAYRDNTVSGSTIGVMIWEDSGATFENDTFERNSKCGVDGGSYSTQFQVTFADCTFKDNGLDVVLDGPWGATNGGTIVLVRPAYNASSIKSTEASGIVIVKWDLRVGVAYESDGRPGAGAGVTITNSRGDEAATLQAGDDGWTEAALLEEHRYSGPVKASMSPYTALATLGGRSNATDGIVLDSSKKVTVMLDDVPPRLEIRSPANNTVTNLTEIDVGGRSEPGALLTVNGISVDVGAEGDWQVSVALAREGANDIVVEARDSMANRAGLHLTVFRDTFPPVFTVEAPAEGLLVNLTSVTVSGSVAEPLASLTLNGAPVAVGPGGDFCISWELAEGQNTLELVARDAGGNVVKVVRHVVRDTTAPLLQLETPADGSATNASTFSASGRIESGATLTVNGRPFPPAGASFSLTLELQEGMNVFVFQTRDRAGNFNSSVLRVLRDSIPPALAIASPVGGARFNRTAVEVAGSTETGATLRVGGENIKVENGSFRCSVNLKEGKNDILVEAWDALFNLASQTVTVHVDTVPPQLNVLGPQNGTLTNQMSVVVNGRTEPGAAVKVAGRDVPVNPQGEFSATVDLDREGVNLIQVVAADGAFNTAETEMAVRRDTVVGYEILSPRDGARVEAQNITVSGRAEAGATVWVGGAEVPLGQDGSFTAVAPLEEGPNTIAVLISDPAGNSESLTLNVTRVRPPAGQPSDPMPLGILAGALVVIAVAAAAGWRLRRRA